MEYLWTWRISGLMFMVTTIIFFIMGMGWAFLEWPEYTFHISLMMMMLSIITLALKLYSAIRLDEKEDNKYV